MTQALKYVRVTPRGSYSFPDSVECEAEGLSPRVIGWDDPRHPRHTDPDFFKGVDDGEPYHLHELIRDNAMLMVEFACACLVALALAGGLLSWGLYFAQ